MLAASGCAAGEQARSEPVALPALSPLPPITARARLPEVPLVGADGRAVTVAAAVGGKAALVSFWATWCDACALEFDALNRLDDRARPHGGMVIGVDVGEPREKAADFARRRGLRYAQLADEGFKLADALGQRRLPATLVLDREGRVVWSGGALDEDAIAAFRAALGALP
jgi:cytochrome c biogenesis protein CcmG, thiol:disulfide interchange protein DsbE